MALSQLAIARWLRVDARTLACFRVAFAVLLLTNLVDRMGSPLDRVAFYTNDGWWPNHYGLFLPPSGGLWGWLFTVSTPGQATVAFGAIALVYVALLVGWHTRVMQVLALVCVASLNFRTYPLQNGGAVVVNVLAVWSAFLPLGARWSVDALLTSLRRHDERDAAALEARAFRADAVGHVDAPAYLFVCLNFAVIYFFNALHKNGPSWRDGSAVHDLAWINRLATPLAVWVRTHGLDALSPAMTMGTLVVEWALVPLILSPVGQRWTRPLAFALIVGLHGNISLLATLGPFSWAMMCFGTLLLPGALWDRLGAWWRGREAPREVPVDLASPAQRFLARVAARCDVGGRLRFVDAPGHSTSAAHAASVVTALPLVGWAASALYLPRVLELARALARTAAAVVPVQVGPVVPRPGWAVRARWWASTALASTLAVAIGSQVLLENWAVPAWAKPVNRPAWMTAVIDYLDVKQGWSMFAPETPGGDVRLVVDATLADGTHLDVLTGAPPDFDCARNGPWGLNQHWGELHGRVAGQPHQWRYLRDFLRRVPSIQGWGPAKQVVALEVFKVSYDAPPLGGAEPLNVKRERLFGDEPL